MQLALVSTMTDGVTTYRAPILPLPTACCCCARMDWALAWGYIVVGYGEDSHTSTLAALCCARRWVHSPAEPIIAVDHHPIVCCPFCGEAITVIIDGAPEGT
jgi:hypothetical protein